jgi:hypothetical protein
LGYQRGRPAEMSSTSMSNRPTKNDPLSQLVPRHQDRAARPILQRVRKGNRGRTVLDAVAEMSKPPRV